MRSAPSVSYPVGRSFFYAYLLVAAGGLGLLAVLLGVFYGGWGGATASGVVLGVWAVTGIRAWQRQPQGQLLWQASGTQSEEGALSNVGAWSWISTPYQQGASLVGVERVYDLQGALLLRLHNADGARTWVWVERRSDPEHWLDIRRALMAHA